MRNTKYELQKFYKDRKLLLELKKFDGSNAIGSHFFEENSYVGITTYNNEYLCAFNFQVQWTKSQFGWFKRTFAIKMYFGISFLSRNLSCHWSTRWKMWIWRGIKCFNTQILLYYRGQICGRQVYFPSIYIVMHVLMQYFLAN